MKELMEYRTQLIDRLESAVNEFRDACLAANDAYEPLGESEWNVHQFAAHTRDVNEMVYDSRARRTAREDNPEFQNFDGDAYMRERYNKDEPLNDLLDDFVKNVEALCEFLKSLPTDAWSRQSRHVAFGNGFTLQTWIERDLAHIEEHLEDIKQGT